jgi:uncharacterized OB-fold protein
MSAFPPVRRDEASAAFFDAAARGELLVKRAPGSGTVLAPGDRSDPVSGSAELEPLVASGTGTLVSWAVVHQAPLPALADAVPYVTAVVELAEGPWLLVRLLTDDPDALHAGAPVRAAFVGSGGEDDGGEVVVAFEPV